MLFRAILLSMSLLMIIVHPLTAAPREITLFPEGAHVSEATRVHLTNAGSEARKAIVLLPAGADISTLTVALSQPPAKLKLEDISWRRLDWKESEKGRNLLARMKKMKEEDLEATAQIKALEGQLQFWHAQAKAKAKTPPEAANFSSSLGRNLRWLHREKLAREEQLAALQKRRSALDKESENLEKDKAAMWEVTVQMTGSQAGDVVLHYDYRAGECGWSPSQRIEGDTAAGKIALKKQALIHQDTGIDWKQVKLNIVQDGAARQTFACVDLPAGSVKRLTLNQQTVPANFTYLLQPALSPHAVVSARLPQAITFAAGSSHGAQCLLDGRMIAARCIAAGEAGRLSFGVYPQITAHRQSQEMPSASPNRIFYTEIRNGSSNPADVVLEEDLTRRPHGKTAAAFDPPPVSGDAKVARWSFRLPAGGRQLVMETLQDAATAGNSR